MKNRVLVVGALSIGMALAASLSAAHAAETVTLCTASKTGVYYSVGQTIATGADKNKIVIKPIETDGSWDNLSLVAKGEKCQAAIVQGDSMLAFGRTNGAEATMLKRVASLHLEYVHAICNRKADVSNLYDLKSDNQHPIAVGENGSGSWITWQNFKNVNKDYEKVSTVFEGGSVAASSVSEGTGPSCMIFVAGLGSSAMNRVNDQYADTLKLVPATGAVFRDAKDEKGKSLYEMKDIPAGTYPNLQPSGWVYGTKPVNVPAQRAILIVNKDISKNTLEALVDATAKVRSTILMNTGEKN